VTWRSVPAKLNAQFDTGVEAEIDVPAVGFRLVFTLRRNNDRSLPASHVIEVQFTTAKDFNGGSVANVPGILMKRAEQSRGSPLAGLAVKVSTDYFLIGLSDVQADREKNIELLRSHGWIDLPIVFSNQRRAIVAIEKGAPGERFFADALAQWGQ
jgi:hypothetical protein